MLIIIHMSVKDVEKQPPEVFYKKGVLKVSQYSQESTCDEVFASCLKMDRCFPVNIVKCFRRLILKNICKTSVSGRKDTENVIIQKNEFEKQTRVALYIVLLCKIPRKTRLVSTIFFFWRMEYGIIYFSI